MRKWLFLFVVSFIVSCSSIDCPVENVVATRYQFRSTSGDSLIIGDTLTVLSFDKEGKLITLYNKGTGKATIPLPISYSHPEDFLIFDFFSGTSHVYDSVWVKKDDIPHFESVDCNAAFFHQLTGVRYTTHVIDSIVIKNSFVDYDRTRVHFYLYPKVDD